MAASHTSALFLGSGIRLAGSVPPSMPGPFQYLDTANKLYDAIFGGSGRVSGTVKIKGTPNYAVHRKVRLIRERDGLVVREQWSDPTTGDYSFDNIDSNYTYTVLSYDYEHNFRAVVADNITPEAMP